ncbi:MAG: MgtC/SapB family protein [Phycisphaerales bacterium]
MTLALETIRSFGTVAQATGELGSSELAFRLCAAAVLGALIGAERSRAEKPADTRTMMLISVGAAAFALIGERVIAGSAGGADVGLVSDPTRVLAYIISGVGFLGAGAILHSKRTVKGLTTASSIWCTAAVGAACGLGEMLIAGVVSGIVLVTLWGPWVYYGVTGKLPPNGSGSSGE